jgi:hypothetical protein
VESSILSSVSLEAGLAAIQQERHQDAIGILEAFCHDCAAQAQWANRSYLQAQMHLVKTYAKNGQTERAMILSQRLAECNNAQVQIWAQQTLKALEIEKALKVETAQTDEPTGQSSDQSEPSDPFRLAHVKNTLLMLFRKPD